MAKGGGGSDIELAEGGINKVSLTWRQGGSAEDVATTLDAKGGEVPSPGL